VWNYQVFHGSNKIGKSEAKKEKKAQEELYKKQQSRITNIVGEDFERLDDGLLRVVVHGEVVKAENFEYDNLHIEYFVDVPKDWKVGNDQILSGCTASCRTKQINFTDTAYFCQPFSYELFQTNYRSDDEVRESWPKIYVHVLASNNWGKMRSEGYGYMNIPSIPGKHTILINCWRPIGGGGYDSILSKMNRLFIGCSPQLDDVTYVGGGTQVIIYSM